MKIRAVAAPSRESNAVGTLECECTPSGLIMVYLGLGAYAEGYAVGPILKGVKLHFPWPEVVEVEERGEGLWLGLSEGRTPHTRLLLQHFDAETGPARAEISKRRKLLFGAVTILALVVLLGLPPLVAGAGAATYSAASLALATAGALGLFALAWVGDRLWLKPAKSSEELRQLFVAELRHYCPRPVASGRPGPPAAPEVDWSRLLLALPRSATAVAIVLTAGSLATIATSAWILRGPSSKTLESVRAAERTPPPPPVAPEPTPAPPGPTAPAAPASATEPTTLETTDQACHCDRADSVLWATPFPQVSTVVIERRLRPHKSHHHVEVELAIVNNSNETLAEPGLLVKFFEAEGKKHTKDRPLYYEGKLRPGQAIKWHVEARGTSFVVENARQGNLRPDELASGDAFATLLSANHRPVRLHGAMMLAYLGDQRAKAGTTELRKALRDEESPFLDRVARAHADVVACQLSTEDKGRLRRVKLCVQNTTLAGRTELGLQLRALDRPFDPRNPTAPPPEIIAEQVWRLPGEFAAQAGRWVSVTFDTDNPSGKPPAALEGFVDEYRLLY